MTKSPYLAKFDTWPFGAAEILINPAFVTSVEVIDSKGCRVTISDGSRYDVLGTLTSIGSTLNGS